MNSHNLQLSCDELRDLAEVHPHEMAVIIEMMIEAEEPVCQDQPA